MWHEKKEPGGHARSERGGLKNKREVARLTACTHERGADLVLNLGRGPSHPLWCSRICDPEIFRASANCPANQLYIIYIYDDARLLPRLIPLFLISAVMILGQVFRPRPGKLTWNLLFYGNKTLFSLNKNIRFQRRICKLTVTREQLSSSKKSNKTIYRVCPSRRRCTRSREDAGMLYTPTRTCSAPASWKQRRLELIISLVLRKHCTWYISLLFIYDWLTTTNVYAKTVRTLRWCTRSSFNVVFRHVRLDANRDSRQNCIWHQGFLPP